MRFNSLLKIQKHDDHLKQLVEDTIKNIRNKSHA